MDLRIGDESSSATALTRVLDIDIGPDGLLYVTQAQSSHVTAFDPSGVFVRHIGQAGSGPGEFVRPVQLGWLGDTLWVADPAGNRLELFGLSGEPAGSIRFTLLSGAGLPLPPTSLLNDGTVFVDASGFSITDALAGRITHRDVLRATRDGRQLNSVTRVPVRAADFIQIDVGGGLSYVGVHPVQYGPIVTCSYGGDRIIVIDRGDASRGERGLFGVTVLTVHGDTTVHRQISYDPVAISATWKDAWYDDRAASLAESGRATPAAVQRALRETVPFQGYFPAIESVRPGADGSIWLKQWTRTDSSIWLVLSDDAVPVARVILDGGSTLMYAGAGFVWAMRRDAQDVPFLVRYRLNREARQGPQQPRNQRRVR